MRTRSDRQWLWMQNTIIAALKKRPDQSTDELSALIGASKSATGNILREMRRRRKVIKLSETRRGAHSVKRWGLPGDEAPTAQPNRFNDPEHTAWMAWWRLPLVERKRRMAARGMGA